MKLEDQVTSLELSKRLKELGVPQESLFYWRQRYSTSHLDIGKPTERHEFNVYDFEVTYSPKPRYEAAVLLPFPLERAKIYDAECSAFTVAELGEMLPWRLRNFQLRATMNVLDEKTSLHQWEVAYWELGNEDEIRFEVVVSDLEAEARGLMLEYLITNKLITM